MISYEHIQPPSQQLPSRLQEACPTQGNAAARADTACSQAPVLPSTLLCLELLLMQPCLDLRATTHLLRRDPGAVLRLYALVSQEFPDCADRPERLEDCIASVDVAELARVLRMESELAKGDFVHSDHAQLMSFAQHALAIAEYAEMVAASLALCEHEAYLVGLLHALGEFPVGTRPKAELREALDTVAIARHWARSHNLPPVLCRAIDEVHRELPDSVWVAMVRAAHDLARHAGQIR